MGNLLKVFSVIPVLLLCAACRMFSSEPLVLTEKDSGSVIDVKTGDTIAIRLEANPTTGYLWMRSVPNDMVVREVDNKYVPLKADAAKPVAGAPAMKVFTYVVTGPGEAGIKMEYRRPWESGKAPLKTFDIMLRASGESMFEQDNGRDGTKRVGSKGQVEYR